MRNLDQIKQSIVNDIIALRNDVRMVEGDTEYDVIVNGPSTEFYRYEVMLEFEDRTRNLDEFRSLISDEAFKTEVAQAIGYNQDGTPVTIDDVNALISARLDAYVADWNIIRSGGTVATGAVTMYLTDASPVSWNSNTEFTSASGKTYNATSSVTNIVPIFSTDKGQYFVTITIQSTTTGQANNATAGSIRTVKPKPTNFSSCTNTASIDGGSDREEDLELIDRAQEAWANRVNGSIGALTQLARAQSYVDDVLPMDQDNESTGVYVGSVCDLFTQFASANTELVEEFFYWPGEANNISPEIFSFTPSKQPLLTTIAPIVFKYVDLTDTPEQVIPDGGDTVISITPDTGTYSGSTKATDKIMVKMPLRVHPSYYSRKLRVLYVYDKNPYKLQSVIDDPDNRMIGPSALIRKAVEVPFRIIAELTVSFGYDQAAVETAVQQNLLIFFNGGTTSYGKQYARKKIGEAISHSDIGTVILRTEGVVSYDTDTFYVINTLTGDLSDPSEINENQYATLYDVLFEFNTYNLSNFNASF